MEDLPAYVSIVFILTTFATVGFLLQAVKAAGMESRPAKVLLFLLPLWIIFQCVLASGGFYLDVSFAPPRLVVFGVLPAVATLIAFLLFAREFVSRMPVRLLTLLHVVRIPVEIVLYWLFLGGKVPQIMTFAGVNYDIVSGILAIVVSLAAFRGSTVNLPLLIGYNILGLILLAIIVSVAASSVPGPMQQMSFEQPNIAVLHFPYILLPTVIVPIVLFSHLAVLYKTLRHS